MNEGGLNPGARAPPVFGLLPSVVKTGGLTEKLRTSSSRQRGEERGEHRGEPQRPSGEERAAAACVAQRAAAGGELPGKVELKQFWHVKQMKLPLGGCY